MNSMSQALNEAVGEGLLRSLDAQFAMMIASDNAPGIMLAAALLSADAGEGHVCLPLERLLPQFAFGGRSPELAERIFSLAGNPVDWHATLLASPGISDDRSATPIKLRDNKLYLHRMWLNEWRVAEFFTCHNRVIERDAGQVRAVLDRLFAMSSELDWQKIAAAVALTRRISVISGGPGTGKTTTVAKLLTALLQLSPDQDMRIQLTAPTGKAAARLTESMGHSLRQLDLKDDHRTRLSAEASTLHRLLGAKPNSQTFRHHAGNPLHLDVLVVDEASMVDLPMMARLIMALPEHAQVIFLGDRDQLASVEAGAVLGDICHYISQGYSPDRAAEIHSLTGYCVPYSNEGPVSPLSDALCLLRKSYRFDGSSGIGQLALAVNQCEIPRVRKLLAKAPADIHYRALGSEQAYSEMISEVADSYADYLRLVSLAAEPGEILQAFGQYQLLCALREGPFGLAGLNLRIEQALANQKRIRLPHSENSRWYAGRPIMIARNDKTLGLFNGDIGIALGQPQSLRVWFAMADGSIKSVQPNRLPEHDTAYAMTVHKSQGSEFAHAALVLPNQFLPVLSRELVYTAITRAKQRLSLYAEKPILEQAIKTGTERRSGLMAYFDRQPNHEIIEEQS